MSRLFGIMITLIIATTTSTWLFLSSDNSPRYYKLYVKEYSTTREIVVSRNKMTMTECIGYQMNYKGSVCIRQPKEKR